MRSRPYLRPILCFSLSSLLLCTASFAEGCHQAGDDSPQSAAGSKMNSLALTLSPLSWRLLGGPLQAVRGSDGMLHVAYALMLTNSFDRAAAIKSVDVLSDRSGQKADAVSHVVTIDNQNITGLVRPFSRTPVFTSADFSTILAAGEAGVVYVDLVFKDANHLPFTLTHRITAQTGEGESVHTYEATEHPRRINCEPVPIISAPLHGKGWVNGNGCCGIIGPHRFVLNSINGELHATEEFAIDWIRLGDDGRAFHDDPRNVHNWYDYDTPVTAASAGRVVGVLNDVKDEIPGKSPIELPLNEIAGNHVIVKLGDGLYVEYDHLVPGSAAVAIGDIVQKGQVLGRLGNSGNSDAPHLHFQIMSRPSTLDGWAVPFVFDSMRLQGTVALTLGELDQAASRGDRMPVVRGSGLWLRDAMPLSLDVVEFP